MSQVDPRASYPSLADRTVVVTGGASGIGAAVVEAFAAQRARVAFLDVADEAAEKLIAEIAAADHPVPLYRRCDLTDVAQLRAAVAGLVQMMGAVDVLVNNAGNDTRHRTEEVTPELWDETLAVNLKHQFFMAQAVLPGMRAAGRGSIINMSSIAWLIPSTNLPAYVTAKAGIVGLTRTLAHEFGVDNVRVNCVLPGAVWTERQERLWLTPEYKAEILSRQALKRLIQPAEVASLILFLASDDSASITNQSFVIDAGWT